MNLAEVRVIVERTRGAKCEICGSSETHLDLHHWLIHRMRNHPELDAPENLGLVCKLCHLSGMANSYKSRRDFWNRQKKRGYKMDAWLASLPLKVKPRFE